MLQRKVLVVVLAALMTDACRDAGAPSDPTIRLGQTRVNDTCGYCPYTAHIEGPTSLAPGQTASFHLETNAPNAIVYWYLGENPNPIGYSPWLSYSSTTSFELHGHVYNSGAFVAHDYHWVTVSSPPPPGGGEWCNPNQTNGSAGDYCRVRIIGPTGGAPGESCTWSAVLNWPQEGTTVKWYVDEQLRGEGATFNYTIEQGAGSTFTLFVTAENVHWAAREDTKRVDVGNDLTCNI